MMRPASRTAPVGVAGVDEHRLAGRRDEQRGVAALDVDDVDVQRGSALPDERGQKNGKH